jgi:hypothetical protein
MSPGAARPDEPPRRQINPKRVATASCLTPIQTDGSPARASPKEVKKHAEWCMIRANVWAFALGFL